MICVKAIVLVCVSSNEYYYLFTFCQLAPWREDRYTEGFVDIRWSQTYEYGYVPNPDLENVFMAVAHDLPDFDSPYVA